MISELDLFTEEVEVLDEGDDLNEEQQPEEDNIGEDDGGNINEDNEEEGTRTVVKPKRVIRNPQPKLNVETLKKRRGLCALPKHFERVRFKGHGHEQQDLSVILKTYEYWCHRLFPKYAFDDCVSQIEKLGSKKPVMTHIKKIRLDMLEDDNDDNNEFENNNFDNNAISPPQHDNNPDARNSLFPGDDDLNEEEQERIRLNRERADQLRKDRLRKLQERISSRINESSRVFDDDDAIAVAQSDDFDAILTAGNDGGEATTSNVGQTMETID